MSFPAIRMRRMRRDAFSRALMREHTLLPSDEALPDTDELRVEFRPGR